MGQFQVRSMTRAELDLCLDRAAAEGWNPGLHDAACFWEIDPHGFFVGELDGKPIAFGAAVRYDARFAFCGLYLVDAAYRGQGYGLELTRRRLEHVGERIVGLDGVLDMADRYERLGYRRTFVSTRYTFIPKDRTPNDPHSKPASGVPIETLAAYDARHFPARREHFLRAWIRQPQSHSHVFLDGEAIRGFGVLRRCRVGFKIGPLFADEPSVALLLLHSLCNQAVSEPVSLDIPNPNAGGRILIDAYAMQPSFACVRMYRGGEPQLPLGRIFGITTFEAG